MRARFLLCAVRAGCARRAARLAACRGVRFRAMAAFGEETTGKYPIVFLKMTIVRRRDIYEKVG